jgi:hypothetical protein
VTIRNTPSRANTDAVQLVHQQRLDLQLAVVPHQFELLGDELRGAGHGADKEVSFM